MKLTAKILLFVFITFLITPTIVSVIEKSIDISVVYSFSEEEQSHKEIKAVCHFDVVNETINLLELNSGLINFEILSKHDKIASKIFIPPPEQV
jgi:hypothetical protein